MNSISLNFYRPKCYQLLAKFLSKSYDAPFKTIMNYWINQFVIAINSKRRNVEHDKLTLWFWKNDRFTSNLINDTHLSHSFKRERYIHFLHALLRRAIHWWNRGIFFFFYLGMSIKYGDKISHTVLQKWMNGWVSLPVILMISSKLQLSTPHESYLRRILSGKINNSVTWI